MAKDSLNNKDYKMAETHLKWVINHSDVSAIEQIASIRLARVLLAENKPDDAIKQLTVVKDKNFLGLIDEVKGDAYLMLNQQQKARQSYGKALTELPNAQIIRPLLQMKYDNLTTTMPS
jgi:predicted negative regulator of RcsB-dependent stress response